MVWCLSVEFVNILRVPAWCARARMCVCVCSRFITNICHHWISSSLAKLRVSLTGWGWLFHIRSSSTVTAAHTVVLLYRRATYRRATLSYIGSQYTLLCYSDRNLHYNITLYITHRVAVFPFVNITLHTPLRCKSTRSKGRSTALSG